MGRTLIIHTLTLTALYFLSVNSVSAQLLKTGPSVFNYNFVDVAYIDVDSADGLGLRFSADIRENYALQFGYTRVSAGRFDADILTGVVAYHIKARQFPDKADWVFDLGFQIIDQDSLDETGLSASAGLRYAVSKELEVNGAVNITTAFDTDVSVSLRALYEVSTGFSAFLETDLGDGTDLGLGVRFYWR